MAVAIVLAGAGCRRGGAASAGSPPSPTPERTMQLDAVFLLGVRDTVPADTTAILTSGQPRHVVLRTGAPDYTTFADVFFDALAFQAAPGSPVRVTLRHAPSAYGLVIESDAPFRNGGEITFKYAVKFPAPAEAITKYGNPLLFERALAVGRLGTSGDITLLASTRPAADNVAAPVAQPGTYVLAAPR